MDATKALKLLLIHLCACVLADKSDKYRQKQKPFAETRYLLYDVNLGEGFNLRRDVYIRIANLVKFLNDDGHRWTLVLPPWGRVYHWKSPIEQERIPWSQFFDIPSLARHIPVIEFEDYIQVTGKAYIDEIYYLQRYKEGWTDGEFTEKLDVRPCLDETYYQRDHEGRYRGWFWGYDETAAGSLTCLSTQAHAGFLRSFLTANTTARSVLLLRAEQLIHGQFSEWSSEWWAARRSLVFAEHLRYLGDEFRREQLNSTDEADRTAREEDWTHMQRSHGHARGGPYVAVHMRRKDFLYAHKEDVPSLREAARQLTAVLRHTGLSTLFVATDAPDHEVEDLRRHLPGDVTLARYRPPEQVLRRYMDGGVAIIDQWICAHARHFVGTSVSTFSFRIHEEREILGFPQDSTYNRLCGDGQRDCEQPTRWSIQY